MEERRAEVLELVFTTFDKELYKTEMKQDAYARGRVEEHM